MESKILLPGLFDHKAELQKIENEPGWRLLLEDKKTPLFVFINDETHEMRCFGNPEAVRIAGEGYHSALNSVIRQERNMNRAQRRKARRN